MSRRHAASFRVLPALAVGLAAFALGGADCLSLLGGEERARCEEVCAKEGECGLRTESACLAALCDTDGFKVVAGDAPADGGVAAPEHDLAGLDANDCERTAADCGELSLCVCPDACARVDECTGDPDATCLNTCETLIEQDPEGGFQENRCKMESSCADLPACSSVAG